MTRSRREQPTAGSSVGAERSPPPLGLSGFVREVRQYTAAERLRLRAWIFYVASLLVALPFQMAGIPLISLLPMPIPLNGAYPFYSLLVVLISLLLVAQFWEHRPLTSLGLRIGWHSLALFLAGALAAFLVSLAVFWAAAAIYQRIPVWPFVLLRSPEERSFSIAQILAIAAYEELYFRSYVLQSLMASIGTAPAIFTISAIFGVIHLKGWAYMVQAALLSTLMSLLYIRTRNLWTSIGFHLGWNFTGLWLVFAVSGIEPLQIAKDVYYKINSVILLLMILLILVLPLRPHPRDQELWDRYVKPAPWPPWRRPKAPHSPPPQSHEEQENPGV